MPSKRVSGVLLDADYINREEKSVVRLFVKTGKGIEAFEDPSFRPYFFVTVSDLDEAKQALEKETFGGASKALKVEEEKKANAEKVLKLSFASVQDLVQARSKVGELPFVLDKSEYDIPFGKRYLLDKGLEPMNGIEFEAENGRIKKPAVSEKAGLGVNVTAFDLETYAPGRFSDPQKDPILMASFASKKKALVLSYGDKKCSSMVLFKNEAEMIKGLESQLKESKTDVVATYNGDLFDFPYLQARARKLGTGFSASANGEEPKTIKKGRDNAVKLTGVQHLDVYQMLRFLSRFAVVNLVKFDLESVVERLYEVKKEKIKSDEINRLWDRGKDIERLASYCREDSVYTLRIAENFMPLMVEICKLVKLPLFDVGRASASVLVEQLLMSKCIETKRLIANKPSDQAMKQRMMNPIKGGYVKEPSSGLHENIAVLDFSSLYPTIIISHNVSPETLGCGHKECREKNLAPNKQWFCQKKKGLMPGILQSLFEKRMKIKKEAKSIGKSDERFALLNARQHALKILLNSFYGYLGYSRSRFYCRECGSAITAWARQYVQWVGREAEKAGFRLLYSDTDSAFLIIPKEKKQDDVKEFVERINSQLPGVMNLELEGFFRRGIFVTKESGEGAKKKYALIDYNGNLKIVGFEYVRRDWARIAKETQRAVIQAVLAEGRPEKAVDIVRETIKELKSGKTKKSDLVVLTQIKRSLGKYDAIGPHVAAAKKAMAKGKEIEPGSVVGYIITRSGKSISDRAQLEEYVNEGNYDPSYYIEHQVVPAVIKIMRELGYSKEDLIQGGKQKTLESFF
jgi:DNA polymerase I